MSLQQLQKEIDQWLAESGKPYTVPDRASESAAQAASKVLEIVCEVQQLTHQFRS